MTSRCLAHRFLLALTVTALAATSAAAVTPAGAPDDSFVCYKANVS